MRLGSVLALVILLASSVAASADDCCGLRCVSQCFQTSYSEPPEESSDVFSDDGKIDWPTPTVPQSSAADWGPFPRLPGLRGVRGLTGVIGNLMQTNPHVGGTFYPEQAVQGQPTSLGMNREFFQFSAPVWSDGDDTVVLSTHVQDTNITTGAILPTTGNPLPTQLWNVWFGMNYFHVFENGVIGAMLVEGGSASDKPFSAARNDSAAVDGARHHPDGDRDAWILGVQASTNSQVLYNIPIPGAAYLYSPSDDFQAIIGFPYSAVNYQVDEEFRLQLLYMFLTTVHTRAIYQPDPGWQLYLGFDWANENYARADRQSSGDRFFYYEKRALAGWQWWWSKHLAIELAGGYAFDRYFCESNGFSFSVSGFNRVNVGSGPFVTLQADYRF